MIYVNFSPIVLVRVQRRVSQKDMRALLALTADANVVLFGIR